MFRKTLFCFAIALCAAVVTVGVASAEPSPFSTLSCNCRPDPNSGSTVMDPVHAGIQDGLVELPASQDHSTSWPPVPQISRPATK